MSSAILQVARRIPISSSLRIQCACRRGYATGNTPSSASASSASASSSWSSSSSSSSADATAAPVSRSICAPDTVLKGVNYLKGQPPVAALGDDAYPEWLWSVLKPRVYEDDGPGGKKERVDRRKANRQAIKDRNFMQTQ